MQPETRGEHPGCSEAGAGNMNTAGGTHLCTSGLEPSYSLYLGESAAWILTQFEDLFPRGHKATKTNLQYPAPWGGDFLFYKSPFLISKQIFVNIIFIIVLKLHITLQVTGVLRLRIRACVARPATVKCGGEKLHKGVCADCSFLEPELPKGGEQLPFVKRCLRFCQQFLI